MEIWKKNEILAQPEACCNCTTCMCDCDAECSCECDYSCIVDCNCGWHSNNIMMSIELGDPNTGYMAQRQSLISGLNTQRNDLAMVGSTAGSVVGAGAAYTYGRTIAYWG